MWLGIYVYEIQVISRDLKVQIAGAMSTKDSYACYPLESFFECHEDCLDFWEKLHDKESTLLILVGPGKCGKTQLAHQIVAGAPAGTYYLVNECETDSLKWRPTDRKTILTLNHLAELNGTDDSKDHHVVYMKKHFE